MKTAGQRRKADEKSKNVQKHRFEKNQTSKQKPKAKVEKTSIHFEPPVQEISKLSFESFLKRLLKIPVQKATDS
jgi:hypothetical protein